MIIHHLKGCVEWLSCQNKRLVSQIQIAAGAIAFTFKKSKDMNPFLLSPPMGEKQSRLGSLAIRCSQPRRRAIVCVGLVNPPHPYKS